MDKKQMRIKKIILIILVIVVLFLGWMLMVDITKGRAYRQNINNIFDFFNVKNKPSELTGQAKPVPQEIIDRLSSTLTNPYSIKDSKIYYQDTSIESVDVATFEVLSNRGFSKDKNHVYYVTTILGGADAPTFEFLSEFLARDKNRMYLNQNPINGSDPQTFVLIEGTGYSKDKKHVFFRTEMIQGAEPATFEPIGVIQTGGDGVQHMSYEAYSKDAKSIYFGVNAVPNSDPATFGPFLKDAGRVLYFKDKNLVYHIREGALQGSDPITFEMLRSGYARDARTVYYSSKPIPSADLATFKVLGDSYAQDKNQLYQDGEVIFNLSGAGNPFEQGALRLKEFLPKDDTAIDVIVATYYDMILFYGNYSEYSIFDKAGKDYDYFFIPLFKEVKQVGENGAPRFEAFRLAFIDPNSPAFLSDFSWNVGPRIGGEVAGRKLLDSNTMLVYTAYEWQSYLGPPPGMCKEGGEVIDKFIFKKINSEWKIWEIEYDIDQWTTHEEGFTKEECEKGINQDKIEKYRIN